MENEDFNTVKYAAWHFPCYRKINCQQRYVNLVEATTTTTTTTPPPDNHENAGVNHIDLSGFDIKSLEDGATWVFLFLLIVTTFIGAISVSGVLCAKGGGRRPFNQFLISILFTDLIMAMVVIPLHLMELFVEPDPAKTPEVSCRIQVFFHLDMISTRSWTIAAFTLLHHLHDGLIPTTQSLMVIVWTWVISGLLVMPTVIVKDSFVDFEECALNPKNYGMIIYVIVVLFILPACILTPLFIKWSRLNKQFDLKRDLSADFLDYDDDDDDIDQDIEAEEVSSSLHGSLSLNSFNNDRKASKATMRFLKSDSNLPRTLFTLAGVNVVAWLPFFSLMLATIVMIHIPSGLFFLVVLWLGFAQSPVTPVLIYFLSDRVHFLISGTVNQVAISSLTKRVRRFTMTEMTASPPLSA